MLPLTTVSRELVTHSHSDTDRNKNLLSSVQLLPPRDEICPWVLVMCGRISQIFFNGVYFIYHMYVHPQMRT